MTDDKDINEIYYDIMDDILLQESISQKVKEISRNIRDNVDIAKIWERSKKYSKRKSWESKTVDDITFEKIKEAIKTIRECTTYFVYKNYFDKLCKLCNIPTGQGVVIMGYELKKGQKDQNYVKISWADGRYKITIPHGSILYHRSTNPNIQELKPVFRGKSARGFLYDTPRVYLTIKRNMPKLAADIYKGNTYMYIVEEDIKTAYIDPLLRTFAFGAVYVDTKNPIKVKKLTPEILEKIKNRFKD